MMLFAQAALALAACESIRRMPALVIALAEQETAGAVCHESSRNVNLCLAHCLGDDQSLDKPPLKVPPLVDAVFIVPAAVLVARHDARPPCRTVVRSSAAPPARILFQSFLI